MCVVLEIKLEVVSRPGLGFFFVEAAKASESPRVIRFDVVRAYSQHEVDQNLRPLFQGGSACPLDSSELDQDPLYQILGASWTTAGFKLGTERFQR